MLYRLTPTTRRLALIPATALVALLPAACSSDADGASTAKTTTSMHDEQTTHAAGQSGPATYEVTLSDYSFSGLPESVAAGSKLSVSNAAATELHELVAFRLPDDETRTVEELVALPPAEIGATLGAPVTVLLAAPGGEQIAAVGDGTLSEPGRYAIICAIPTGVAPEVYLSAAAQSNGEPPQVDGGAPHMAHGMHTELTVS